MRLLLALVLTQIAAGIVAVALTLPGGDSTRAHLMIGLPLAALWLRCALRPRREQLAPRPPVPPVAEPRDRWAEYHKDCVAWAEGALPYEDLLLKWHGRVPKRSIQVERGVTGTPNANSATGVAALMSQQAKKPLPMDPLVDVFKEVMGQPRPEPEFRPHQYVRWAERIWSVESSARWTDDRFEDGRDYSMWLYDIFNGCRDHDQKGIAEANLELAVPQPGEVWRWYACSRHHDCTTPEQTCPPDGDPARNREKERAAAECGCLTPVSFGKGLDARASSNSALGVLPLMVEAEQPTKWKEGQWVRLKRCWNGCWLGCVIGSGPEPMTVDVRTQCGPLTMHASALEPALPREGEWWVKDKCEDGHGGTWLYEPIQWRERYVISPARKRAAACGCMHPINVGKGE